MPTGSQQPTFKASCFRRFGRGMGDRARWKREARRLRGSRLRIGGVAPGKPSLNVQWDVANRTRVARASFPGAAFGGPTLSIPDLILRAHGNWRALPVSLCWPAAWRLRPGGQTLCSADALRGVSSEQSPTRLIPLAFGCARALRRSRHEVQRRSLALALTPNVLELFWPLDKPAFAALPLFVGGCWVNQAV
jgi:hypothetical protein